VNHPTNWKVSEPRRTLLAQVERLEGATARLQLN